MVAQAHPGAGRVLVAVSCGGVRETCDAGDTWEVRCEGMWAAYMPPEGTRDGGATFDLWTGGLAQE